MSIMLREIREQPAALERTLRAEEKNIARVGRRLTRKQIPLIVLVARGTSDNAARFARYVLEITTGIPVSLSAPSVQTMYGRRLRLEGALVVGISQSGEGADVNVVLESARRSGAHVLAITNSARSAIAAVADECFVTRAGRERSVAATKTYTTELMLLHMLAEALAGRSFEDLRRIPEYAERVLALEPSIAGLVERYRYMDYCVAVGRGVNYGNAYELSIKLMETCYVIAERFSSADFLHGPVAMIERDFPVFLFAPPGKVFADLRSLAERLRRLQAESIVISSEKSVLRLATSPVAVPVRIPDLLSPIPYIIPGQLFAAHLATRKGLCPDRPRSLSKITRTL